MLIGVPKEIKDHEYRVGLTPAGVHALVEHGHPVVVETGAGARVGFTDSEYVSAGAKIAQRAADCWAAELVVKVKELQEPEYSSLRRGQILFAYLHLAPEPQLLDALLRSGVAAIVLGSAWPPYRLRSIGVRRSGSSLSTRASTMTSSRPAHPQKIRSAAR